MKNYTLSAVITILLFALSNFTPAQTTHVVQVSNFAFTPSSLTVNAGDTVQWVWVNGMHTTTSDNTSGAEVWNAPVDQSHTSYSFVFTTAGTYQYKCLFHASLGMVGTITVASPTSVSETVELPAGYKLEQNFPNPFNPSTVINYSVPRSSFVKLVLYNAAGQTIKTLVNQEKSPGSYSVILDDKNLPSGIYFYSMRAGNFTSVKKLVLLK